MDEDDPDPPPETSAPVMSGQSLFPDDYPDEPDMAPRRRTTKCCNREVPLEGVVPHLAHVVHILGHTRTAFSLSTAAAIAEASDDDTEVAINAAVELGWLAPVPPESYLIDPLPGWFGRLPKRT